MHGPTAYQRSLLELLAGYRALTTDQIHQLVAPATYSSCYKVLERLRVKGWLNAQRVWPERGRTSPVCWHITPAGQALVGAEPTVTPASLALVRRCQPLLPRLGSRQLQVLTLLAEWGQLTTSQLALANGSGEMIYRTYLTLWRLERRGLISGAALDFEQGAAAEYYWWLRPRGAAAIPSPYRAAYARPPSRSVIQYRTLQLQTITQALGAGWAILRPRHYAQPPLAPDTPTPQAQHLATAYLDHEGQRLADLLACGADRGELQPRLDRWRQHVVAGIVPWHCNDYVIYWPATPTCAAVLIPHRPGARRGFWTGRPHQPPPGSAIARNRLEQYGRLASYLPVLAVFPRVALGHHYAPLLHEAGLQWTTPPQLRATLAPLHCGQDRRTLPDPLCTPNK